MDAVNRPVCPQRLSSRISATAVVSLLVGPAMAAADQPTAEDQKALGEYAAAQPRDEFMYHVMADEIRRILGERPGQPSPEVAKLMNPSTPGPDLGDTRVPLHLRIIEQRRREAVAGIRLAQYTLDGHCENPQPRPEQLLDAAWREKTLQAIKCERDKLDRYQVGMHKVNKEHEASVLALHLPHYTEEKVLAAARASTARQDASLESDYSKRRASLRHSEEYIMFIDSHAARIHFIDGHVVFDDPADFKASQELGNRLKADLESQQSE